MSDKPVNPAHAVFKDNADDEMAGSIILGIFQAAYKVCLDKGYPSVNIYKAACQNREFCIEVANELQKQIESS